MPNPFTRFSADRSCGVPPQAVPAASRCRSPRAVAALLIAVALVTLPASLGDTASHLGPVTDLAVTDHHIYSISQAGILEGVELHLERTMSPAFRVTTFALTRPPDGSPVQLLFAGGDPGVAGRLGLIKLTDTAPPSPVVIDLGRDLLYDLAVSPDGELVAIAGTDGCVRVCELGHLTENRWSIRHRHTAVARVVSFSPDGQWLASAGLDGAVIISKVAAPDGVPRQLLDHTAGVESLAWSPDSTTLASGSRDSKVRLHEAGGKLIRTYSGLGMDDEPVAGRVEARVLALAWSQSHLVAGTSKGSLHVLSQDDDTATPLGAAGLDPIFSLAFDRDGALLVGGHSRLWRLRVDR